MSRCYQTPLAPGASSRRSLALFPLCRPLGQRGRSSPLAARPLLNDARSNCAHHRTHWRALPPALRRGNQRETDVFKLHRPRSFGFRPRPTCARGVYTSLCVKTCRSFSLIALPEDVPRVSPTNTYSMIIMIQIMHPSLCRISTTPRFLPNLTLPVILLPLCPMCLLCLLLRSNFQRVRLALLSPTSLAQRASAPVQTQWQFLAAPTRRL